MNEKLSEKIGLYVSHLMFDVPAEPREHVISAFSNVVSKYKSNDTQIIVGSTFGHESDGIVMILSKTADEILEIERAIKNSGLIVTDSFLSITELSEYTTTEEQEQARLDGLDETEEEKQKMMNAWRERMEIYERHRLFPEIPEKEFMCFYPMSKKREVGANWFSLPFEERVKLMQAHGQLGRSYSGRILQLITGATGLTDWEWGVTLFSNKLTDIKDIIYEMRFDEASAIYGEFGHFTVAKICDPSEL